MEWTSDTITELAVGYLYNRQATIESMGLFCQADGIIVYEINYNFFPKSLHIALYNYVPEKKEIPGQF